MSDDNFYYNLNEDAEAVRVPFQGAGSKIVADTLTAVRLAVKTIYSDCHDPSQLIDQLIAELTPDSSIWDDPRWEEDRT